MVILNCLFYMLPMLPRTQNQLACILNVELLLCVAKWINQSKQTTGRRIERENSREPLKAITFIP